MTSQVSGKSSASTAKSLMDEVRLDQPTLFECCLTILFYPHLLFQSMKDVLRKTCKKGNVEILAKILADPRMEVNLPDKVHSIGITFFSIIWAYCIYVV